MCFLQALCKRFFSAPIEDKKIINGHQTEDEVFDEADNSPTIENAIQEKDFDKLVKYVLEGDAERLAERSSEDEEMQEFIKNIPAFQVNCTKAMVLKNGGAQGACEPQFF